jgi:MFS family permease
MSLLSPNPIAVVRRFPRPVRLLLAGTLVNKLGTFILPYLALVLIREWGLRENEAARLLFAYGGGTMVSVLVGGWLADLLGRRRTLLLSLAGSGALAVALGLAPSRAAFVPLLMALGFIGELYRPAAVAIISDLLPSSERASGFAGLRMAVNLGWAAGTTLGGLLADWDWRLLFVGDGVTTLAYAAIVYLAIPETRPAAGASPRPSAEDPAAAMPAPALAASPAAARRARGQNPLLDPVQLLMVAVALLFTLVFCSNLSVLPLTVTQAAGYPAVVFGALIGVNGLLVAVFEISIVARLRSRRRLRVAALGNVLCAIGFGMVGLVLHWSWFLLAVLVMTAGEILASPLAMSFVADWAPPAARGRYLGLYQATWSVGFALNPLVALPLHAALGERAFWGLIGLVPLPAALILLRLDRTTDRPERLRGLAQAPTASG